jgi:low temperature requirement protein LtrA
LALAYVTIQVGRSAFTIWAVRGRDPQQALNFQRILSWQALAGAFWIVGAFLEGEERLAAWAAGAALETFAPSVGFFVPGLGASKAAQWNVEGGHLSERCALFLIIALGESILVTGATFAELHWSALHVMAFVTAFVGSVAMWWIYFDTGSERSEAHMVGSGAPGRMARLGYTYIHQIIIIGVIVCAVSDEIILAHPDGHTSPEAAFAIIGGPAFYLLGVGLFKTPLLRRFPLSHLAGLVVLLALAPFASRLGPLGLAMAATVALLIAAGWEMASLRRMARARGA